MSETNWNKKVQDYAEAMGGYAVKTIVSNKAGVHDMLVCLPDPDGLGRFCSMEGKLDYNEMSSLQLAARNKVIRSGGLSREIKTWEDVEIIFMWVRTKHIQKIEDEVKQIKSITL